MAPTQAALAQRLFAIRRGRELTYENLAALIGIDVRTLYRLRAGAGLRELNLAKVQRFVEEAEAAALAEPSTAAAGDEACA